MTILNRIIARRKDTKVETKGSFFRAMDLFKFHSVLNFTRMQVFIDLVVFYKNLKHHTFTLLRLRLAESIRLFQE